MSLLAGFAIYFVIWWMVLFCVLPLNVQSQAERGHVTAGTEPGAPVSPQLLVKAAITTGLALLIFIAVYLAWEWVDL